MKDQSGVMVAEQRKALPAIRDSPFSGSLINLKNGSRMTWPDDYINKIICGDCLEVMKGIPDGAIDLIVTDPPYGTTKCEWDSVIDLHQMWHQLQRLTKENGAIIMTCSQPFTTQLIASNMKLYKYNWVWDKKRACASMLAKNRPLKYHEDVCVFYEQQPTYNPQMTKGIWQKKSSGGRTELYGDIPEVKTENNNYYPRSIQAISTIMNMYEKLHPCQKPVELMGYFIKTYSDENELILDFTCGSGSTPVAAKMLNRKYIGIEINPDYCKIAEDRLRQFELFNEPPK